ARGQEPTCSVCQGASANCVHEEPEHPDTVRLRELEVRYEETHAVLEVFRRLDWPSAVASLTTIRSVEGPEVLRELARDMANMPTPRLAGFPRAVPLVQTKVSPSSVPLVEVQPGGQGTPKFQLEQFPIIRWTQVSRDEALLGHLFALFWTWDSSLAMAIDRDLFIEHLCARNIPAPQIKATIPGGFCSEALINAMLAIATFYYDDETIPKDDMQAIGRAFADEAIRLLEDTDQPATIPLMQALIFVWTFEEVSGNWDEAKRIFNRFFYLYATSSFFDAKPLPQTTEGVEIDRRTQVALSTITWGIYSLDAKIHILNGRQMWTDKPVLPRPCQDDVSLSSTWCSYPVSNEEHRAYQKEHVKALCDFAETVDHVLQELEKDSGKPPPDYFKSRDLYFEVMRKRTALDEQFGFEGGLIPSKMMLQVFYDMLALKILAPFSILAFSGPGGAQSDHCRAFQHTKSILANLANYRVRFGVRMGYWMAHACRCAAMGIVPFVSRNTALLATLDRSVELLQEATSHMWLAEIFIDSIQHCVENRVVESHVGSKTYYDPLTD
ncbi:hypothetical protein AK830_g12691, partial [Neonectria ditissima]